ncbi:Peptidase-M3 domain-containing protein [Aphelenchoides besseyi]|nr:Peptidase-M3 domain-containing protein [Aphelenchoides besseyi]
MRTLGYRCTNRSLKRLLSTAPSSSHSSRNKPLLFVKQNPTSESQNRGIVFKIYNEPPHKITGYFVTFPSIPDETIENNSHLANIAQNADWPALTTASPKEFYEGTIRLLMEHGATVLEHMDLLENDKDLPLDFDHVVDPLTTEAYDMEYAFNTLLLKMLTDWPECSRFAFDVDMHHVKMMGAREKMEKLGNKAFQDALLKIYDQGDAINRVVGANVFIDQRMNQQAASEGTNKSPETATLKNEKAEHMERERTSPWKNRLIMLYLMEIKALGVDRWDKKTRSLIGSWSRFMDQYRVKYLNNVIWTNSDHTFDIPTAKALNDAPPHVKHILSTTDDSENGPWRGKMEPESIYTLLRYCGDRSVRQTAWQSWISRAAFDHQHYNNSVNIEELRHNAEGLAKTLGYGSISEHRLANKMAGTTVTVRKFLSALTRRMRPAFQERMESWQRYAAAQENITGGLEAFDMFYVCRREAEAHCNVESLELMKYFPFWQTFENLVQLFNHLFGLKFVNITDTGLERCHPSVRIYSIADQSTGEHLGRLYIDPFQRKNKKGHWNTFLGRPANQIRGLDKLVYLIGDANEPTVGPNGQPDFSLLHYSQLKDMLFQVGRAVQLLCSRSPYRELTIPQAPMFSADWDGVDYFPTFVRFFMYKPSLLAALSCPNVETGEVLSEKSIEFVSLALSRSTLWESYRTLFWADYDLTIYEMEDRKQGFWLDIYRNMYKEYFPFKLERYNYQPCSFTPIFAMQSHMSMYYRKLWCELLALDIHDTFKNENDPPHTGERLKNTLLNHGALEFQGELYRRFQGRDPNASGICDFYDPPPTDYVEDMSGSTNAKAGLEYVRKHMPQIGFGTYLISEEPEIRTVIEAALKCGYRFFDTAQIYRNEKIVGKALKDLMPKFGLKRQDIFVTSKLNPKNYGKQVYERIRESVEAIGLGYVDLFLLHWPGASGIKVQDKRNVEMRKLAWNGMEKAYNEGLVRAIGVSNFEPRHLSELVSYCHVHPALNQCEFHPAFTSPHVLKSCAQNDVIFQAYSSFGSTDNNSLLSYEPYDELAKKYDCSVSQLLLAWALNQGISVLPKSLNPDHIRSNFEASKIKISPEDVEKMKWSRERKFCWDPKDVA